MMELLYKLLKHPEPHADLYDFTEEMLIQLDKLPVAEVANFPIFYCLHLAAFFGFQLQAPGNDLKKEDFYADLELGTFIAQQPHHPHFLEPQDAKAVADILHLNHVEHLHEIKLNRQRRRAILIKLMEFYALHLQDFGQMKTLTVMYEVL